MGDEAGVFQQDQEHLGCGKGQSAESLGTVNEEAVCDHMFQGLFLKES